MSAERPDPPPPGPRDSLNKVRLSDAKVFSGIGGCFLAFAVLVAAARGMASKSETDVKDVMVLMSWLMALAGAVLLGYGLVKLFSIAPLHFAAQVLMGVAAGCGVLIGLIFPPVSLLILGGIIIEILNNRKEHPGFVPGLLLGGCLTPLLLLGICAVSFRM